MITPAKVKFYFDPRFAQDNVTVTARVTCVMHPIPLMLVMCRDTQSCTVTGTQKGKPLFGCENKVFGTCKKILGCENVISIWHPQIEIMHEIQSTRFSSRTHPKLSFTIL